MPKKSTATERPAVRPEEARSPRIVHGSGADELEALRDSKRMLTSLLGDLPGMVYRCNNDKNWTTQFLSEGCFPLTGYPTNDFTSGVCSYANLVHPEDRERIWNETQTALAARRPFKMVYRINTASGEEKWVWEQGHGVFGPKGDVLCLEGFITDVTERVAAEKGLRDSEARFRSLVNLSSHWYWEQDAELRFIRFEGRYVERNRPLFARFIGKRPWECGIESEDGSPLPSFYSEDPRTLNDVVLLTSGPDGQRTYIQVSGEPILGADGHIQGYRGVGRDITKQKLAEQATVRLGKMYAALSATNEAILRVRSSEELYQKVCDAAVHGGKFITTGVLLAQPGEDWARVAASTGVGAALLIQSRISMDASRPEGRGTVGTAYRSAKPCVSNDYLSDERLRPWYNEARQTGVAAAAAIPLFNGGKTIGVILFYSSEKGAFDDEIVKLLERLAESVTFALDNLDREKEQERAEQAARRLSKMYAVLSATNEAILRATSEEMLLQKVCEAAVEGGKFVSASMIKVAPESTWVNILAYAGIGREELSKARISIDGSIPQGRGLVGTAFRTRAPAVSRDLETDERLKPWHAFSRQFGIQSAAAMPLGKAENMRGIMLFSSNVKDAFDEDIVKLLERMAENVSFALDHFEREGEQERAERATRRLSKMYAVLSATNEAILRSRSPEELYQKVCDAAVHGGKFIASAALFVERNSEWFKVAVFAGMGADQWATLRISTDESRPEGRGMVGIAYRTGKPSITNDYVNDERLRPWVTRGQSYGIGAAGAIPIFCGGRAIGALLFYSSEKDAFDEEIVKLLQDMAENVSFALDHFEHEKERLHAEKALRESEERFKSLTEFSSDWFWEQDEELRFTMMSYNQTANARQSAEALIGKRRWELPFYPDMTETDWEPLKRLTSERRPFRDFLIKRRDQSGQITYSAVSGVPIIDAKGTFKGYRGTGRDVTDRIRAEAAMRKLSGAIEQTADCVMITDRDGTIEYVNAAYERTTGYTSAESIGRKPSILKSGVHGAAFYERLWTAVLAGETFSDVFVNRKKSGELYYEERTISPLRDAHGRITHFIATGKDITERMQAQERLQHIAHHDALTGLPNRVLFLDRLNQALIRAHWQKRVVGAMFLDLDRFKNINDTLGHDTGDALLKAMAARLQGCIRAGDSVARLGGDEFAVLLEDVAHAEDISAIAGKILGAFMLPFAIQGHELFITASIGISMYPTDGTTPATLLKNADAAMYRAKDLGKNNYQFYSADMSAAAFERLTLESSLRRALEREEFVLHYQPQIDLATGQVIAVEALVRWQHPEFGLLAPTQFISIAEETGAIVQVGEWVARKAMVQVRRWRESGFPHLRIAVNVSGRQFNEPNFVDMIANLLEETGLPPEALELEITESVIMKNAEKTVARLRALHNMGVRFAIDDFGTGYSSLSYLRRFAIHTLKVDKSFIRDITADSGDVEIVKTIIMMARGLKLSVIAEGVETREQLVFLKSHGCHAVQGYLIARPLTVDVMSERLKQGDARPWLP